MNNPKNSLPPPTPPLHLPPPKHIMNLLVILLINLETGMERDEEGVVLGSTRLSGSQWLHR
jgi:hypothetical protein